MCGIFGFMAWEREMPALPALCGATGLLRHRGPDGGAYWHERGVFLGHRRLAIIDLTTGDQPMTGGSGRYVITFNGEIYNYPELREQLRAAGRVFHTTSDTEVILAGYETWGPDVVRRLEGMFAFALYDRVERTVLLARDRFGEKPLLVAHEHGTLVFASEMSPIVAIDRGRREIDLEALGGYLTLNYVPGNRTLARGIRRIAPGEWRLYGADGVRAQARYWNAADAAARERPPDSEDAVLDEIQARVDGAMRVTLRSDVPVGLFLSGGIDSSIVAESAARLGNLHSAFCVDFSESGFSEWPRAAHVAQRLGIDLVRVPLDASVLGEFLDVTQHLDDPLADSSAMAVWTVSRAAARRVKVVLSGDGGDELFGGYLTYPATRWHARLKPWLPRAAWALAAAAAARVPVNERVKVGTDYKMHRFLRALPLDTAQAHFTWNGTWLPAEAAQLVGKAAQDAAALSLARLAASHRLGHRPSLRDLQLADLAEYLPNDILAKVDRTTMAHGLESRAPLLNSDVAALALALPDHRRVRGTATKVILRRLCERHFGAAHAGAGKQGFSLPIHRWLRREGKPLVRALLSPDRLAAIPVLDAPAVERAVAAHLSGQRAIGWELWGLMVLVAWHEQRLVSPPRAHLLPGGDLRAIQPQPPANVAAR